MMIKNRLFIGLLIALLLMTFSVASAQDATPEATSELTEEVATSEAAATDAVDATEEMMMTEDMMSTQDATGTTGSTSASGLPDQVVVSIEGLFPEGVEYDTLNQRFLVSSTSDGMIRSVADDGSTEVLVMDNRLPSTLGLEADEANNRLLVAATDMEMMGFLGIYDLTTGDNINLIDLRPLTPNDPEHFVNDVAVDSAGNAYVTDSYAGVIYQVDPQGNASIFLEDESFSTQFALNGIVYNEAGNYLLAVKVPYLIKIPLDNTAAFTQVIIAETFVGADGLVFLDDSTLAVVTNNPAKVYRVESNDAFATATVTGTFETGNVNPTTVAARDGEAYVLYAYLNAEEQVITDFPIQRAAFEAPTAASIPTEAPMDMTAESTNDVTQEVTTEAEATVPTTPDITSEPTVETEPTDEADTELTTEPTPEVTP